MVPILPLFISLVYIFLAKFTKVSLEFYLTFHNRYWIYLLHSLTHVFCCELFFVADAVY